MYKILLPTSEPDASDLVQFMEMNDIQREVAPNTAGSDFEEYYYSASCRSQLEEMIQLFWGPNGDEEYIEEAPNSYNVVADFHGSPHVIGAVSWNVRGWIFVPFYQSRPSRRRWPSPQAALKGRVKKYALIG